MTVKHIYNLCEHDEGKGLCLKDFIRYSIFYVSPNLYQILIFKREKENYEN